MKDNGFWRKLRDYFSIYLPRQRSSSERTIDTCQKAWNLLLRYLIKERNYAVSAIDYKIFTKERITEFLDEMEMVRKWKPSTRNNRLSCIRSFFKYAGCDCPEAYIVYADLGKIALKKGIDNSRVVNYLTEDSFKALVSVIEVNTKRGLRDRFFLTLMYDTAARNGEMLKLKLSDINTETETAYLFGKGSKLRMVPLSKETLEMFTLYMKLFHNDSERDCFLFYTIHKGVKTSMSDDNVARFLTEYAQKAGKENSNIPNKVHPHMIRHSRAMHLYKGGMPLSVLSEFLGHENPETTLIYAHADTEMKREAIENASDSLVLPEIDNEKPIWNDKDIIGRLLRGY